MKLALAIGINDYPGTGSDLHGCVNDALDWAAELGKRDFDVRLLLDGEATGDAIRAGIRQRLEAAGPGDTVVVTYSGHGTWVPDADGDEPDRRDEALCPHDVNTRGPLLDDELFELFLQRRRGVRLVFVSDSCHSGTVSRYAAPTGSPDRLIKFLAPEVFLSARAAAAARGLPRLPRGRPRHAALLLSGCQDIEYSYDAVFDGRPNGAFTYVALAALRRLPGGTTYRDWMRAICAALPSRDYPQQPGLQGTSAQKSWPLLG
ncbi:MAG TPA: caspase family protein [Pilimelia sp.]|nr:caspase family protein [Pilimelia sp.]